MDKLIDRIGELSRLSGEGCKLTRIDDFTLSFQHRDIEFTGFSEKEIGELLEKYISGRYPGN